MKIFKILSPMLLIMASACSISAPSIISSIPTAPADLADVTTMDEKGLIAAAAIYTASSKIAAGLASNGKMTGKCYRALDQKMYDALEAVRNAYAGLNATTFNSAFQNLRAAASSVSLLGKAPSCQ